MMGGLEVDEARFQQAKEELAKYESRGAVPLSIKQEELAELQDGRQGGATCKSAED
jgi:hypothetical protein